MLQYDRIDISKGIDINITGASIKCIICHYWCFEDIGYKFEPHVCNGCDDVLMMACELRNIATMQQGLIIDLFYGI